jgi:phospholipase D-like protein
VTPHHPGGRDAGHVTPTGNPMIAASTATLVFILIPLLIVWVIGIFDILRSSLRRSTKAVWIVIVLILPVVGTVIYFATRRPTPEDIEGIQAAHGHHPASDGDTLGRK